MPDILLRRFQPLHLKLEGVGPFRSAFEMPLTDKDGTPSNFFLLVSRNGFGKTTVLETIYGLMAWLQNSSLDLEALRRLVAGFHPDLKLGGRAQIDIRIELESGEKSTVAVLSLFTGSDLPLRTLTPSLLEQAQASLWCPLQLSTENVMAVYLKSNQEPVIQALLEAIDVGAAAEARFTPGGDSLFLPTALYFTADRRIVQPSAAERAVKRPALAYGPAHKFTIDGDTWETSLDGLLVWYEWLGGGLFEQTRELVNSTLFSDGRKRLAEIDRHALAAVIEVEQEDGTKFSHGLDRLSHGERSLLHLLVRSAYHRSGSTILLLDEMETHLHPKWQYKLMALLKEWIRKWPDLTVIATTHQPALIEEFAFERPEEGLVKGGYIIEASEL